MTLNGLPHTNIESILSDLSSDRLLSEMVLAQDEIDACREAFLAFDKDRSIDSQAPRCRELIYLNSRSGTIDVWELRQVLQGQRCACNSTRLSRCVAMGQQPTEEELFQMISEVDNDMSGAIGSLSLCTLRISLPHTILDFAEFLQVIDNQKDRAAMYDDDSDMSTER